MSMDRYTAFKHREREVVEEHACYPVLAGAGETPYPMCNRRRPNLRLHLHQTAWLEARMHQQKVTSANIRRAVFSS